MRPPIVYKAMAQMTVNTETEYRRRRFRHAINRNNALAGCQIHQGRTDQKLFVELQIKVIKKSTREICQFFSFYNKGELYVQSGFHPPQILGICFPCRHSKGSPSSC